MINVGGGLPRKMTESRRRERSFHHRRGGENVFAIWKVLFLRPLFEWVICGRGACETLADLLKKRLGGVLGEIDCVLCAGIKNSQARRILAGVGLPVPVENLTGEKNIPAACSP